VAGELLRVRERKRAAQLARHYRDTQHLSLKQIAQLLGRSRATVREYLYDPDGTKARQVKERYRSHCKHCNAQTSGAGPGHPQTRCRRCATRAAAKWDKQRIQASLRAWHQRHGRPATTTDLSLTYARKRAPHDGGARLKRLQEGWEQGPWPPASVVQYHFGTVQLANEAALQNRTQTAHTRQPCAENWAFSHALSRQEPLRTATLEAELT
jgi:hypothetical protein